MVATIALALWLNSEKLEWSKPVGGLVGRIEVVRKGEKNGTPKLVPYLVLRNVTDSLGTVDVFLSNSNLKLSLVDAKGKEIRSGNSGLNGRNGFIPNPFWLQIPFDSTVRINASLEGYFNQAQGELLLETDFALLFLPKGYSGEAFLRGTFTIKDPPHEARSMRWEGQLALPKIKVWDGRRITAPPAD